MALILSRKVEQTIRIGDDVTIRVIGMTGDNVRLAIEAPQSLRVHRGEVYARIRDEQQQAAAAGQQPAKVEGA